MFCSKCGKQIDDNAKFCGGCGAKTGAGVQSVPLAQNPPVIPTNVNTAASAPSPMTHQSVPTPPPIAHQSVPTPAPVVHQAVPTPPPVIIQSVPTPPPVHQAVPTPPPVHQTAPVPPQPVVQPVYQQPAAVQPQPIYQQPAAAQPGYAPVGQPQPLNFNVFGANLPAVSIKLNAGESIYTQSGGMVWMDNGITMTTNMQGGLMKGLGRMFSGDSLFMATYTSSMPNQEIAIASTFPGSIASIELKGNSIIAQKSAFLCAQQSITLSAFVTRSIGAGLFGGEGFILQKMTGYGRLFLEIDGSLVERTLAPGQKLKVDTGNVAAFEESVNYQSEMVKGFKNILFGGEGLFLTTLTGPGKVWLQTMTMPTFAKQLIPFLPKPSSN